MSAPLLSVSDLACERNLRVLFSELSFRLDAGELLQVAGPNGVGKTTLLRTLCGLIPAAAGQFHWRGEPVTSPWEYSDELAWIGHRPAIREMLTPYEMVQWYARINGLDPVDAGSLLAEVGLAAQADVPCRHLSAGQRRRVALATLKMRRVGLWVLDEPFTSLDIAGTNLLRDWMADYAQQGGAVLFTTHQSIELPVARHRILELGAGVAA